MAKSSRRSSAALGWLAAVHEAAEQAGILVPRLLPSQDGRLVVNGITMEKFLNGSTPAANQLADLLPCLQEFHSLAQHLPQRPDFASSRELVYTNRGGDVDLGQMSPQLVVHCRRFWQTLGISHVDLVGEVIELGRGGQNVMFL